MLPIGIFPPYCCSVFNAETEFGCKGLFLESESKAKQ